jgi:hypothetical protein
LISLTHKPVNNRTSRPAWAENEKQLVLHVMGKRVQRNITIARMYWLENNTAQEIADELEMKLFAVQAVINRLRKEK